MDHPVIDQETLKRAVKEALAETLREDRDLLREALAEAMEDVGLAEAIRQGLESDRVDRNEVMKALKEHAGRNRATVEA